MRNHRILRGLKIALFIIVASVVFGFVVMGLWNWLMPAVFGWHRITFWQGLGLFVLSKILFGGFHRGSCHRGHWKHRMKERWESMTPEEREKFRERMHDCRSHWRHHMKERWESMTPEEREQSREHRHDYPGHSVPPAEPQP